MGAGSNAVRVVSHWRPRASPVAATARAVSSMAPKLPSSCRLVRRNCSAAPPRLRRQEIPALEHPRRCRRSDWSDPGVHGLPNHRGTHDPSGRWWTDQVRDRPLHRPIDPRIQRPPRPPRPQGVGGEIRAAPVERQPAPAPAERRDAAVVVLQVDQPADAGRGRGQGLGIVVREPAANDPRRSTGGRAGQPPIPPATSTRRPRLRRLLPARPVRGGRRGCRRRPARRPTRSVQAQPPGADWVKGCTAVYCWSSSQRRR